MVKLLIDGDMVLHRATAAVETEVRWDEENHMLYSNEEAAWDVVLSLLQTIGDRFKSTNYIIAFSSSPIFRLDIDPNYKSNRAKQRKPLAYAAVKERMEREFKCVSFPRLEADDVIGILATKPMKDRRVVWSIDKDFKSIPCTLFDSKEVTVIDEEQADYWHMYQTLVGDVADGYPGCPGIGPKTAEKLLSGEGGKWPRILAAFDKKGLTEEAALTQARLARILRWSDWDNENKRPILWLPK